MVVSFGVSFAFYPGSDPELNAVALKALLDALIALNRAYLRTASRYGKRIPTLYNSGVRYGRAPAGTLDTWDSIPDLYNKGYGDCKSLTAAFVAQARELGHDCEPTFRYTYRTLPKELLSTWYSKLQMVRDRFGADSVPYKALLKLNDGGLDYHILVLTDGTMPQALTYSPPGTLWIDPSKKLGMGKNENA
jgi:hypothetical protein